MISLGGGCGGLDKAGGGGSLLGGCTGNGELAIGNGAVVSLGGVIGGDVIGNDADGWDGGCLGKFSWKVWWSSLVMWSVKEVRRVHPGSAPSIDDGCLKVEVWLKLD